MKKYDYVQYKNKIGVITVAKNNQLEIVVDTQSIFGEYDEDRWISSISRQPIFLLRNHDEQTEGTPHYFIRESGQIYYGTLLRTKEPQKKLLVSHTYIKDFVHTYEECVTEERLLFIPAAQWFRKESDYYALASILQARSTMYHSSYRAINPLFAENIYKTMLHDVAQYMTQLQNQ